MKSKFLLSIFLMFFCTKVFSDEVLLMEKDMFETIYMKVEDEKVFHKMIDNENYVFTKDEDFKVSLIFSSTSSATIELTEPYKMDFYDLPYWRTAVVYKKSSTAYRALSVYSYILQDSKIDSPYVAVGQNVYFPSTEPVYFKGPFTGVCVFPPESCNHDGVLGSGYRIQSVIFDGVESSPLLNEYYNYHGLSVVEEGMHTVEIFAEDNLGNSTGGKIFFCYDNTGPEISVDFDDGHWFNSGINISAEGVDGISGLDTESWRYSLDGSSSFNGADPSNREIFLDVDGIYEVQFCVKDKAGNETVSPVKIVKIDSCPPEIETDISNGSTWVACNRVEAYGYDSLSGVDDSSWECFVDGMFFCNGKVADNLSDGFHSIAFKVKDKAGNIAEKDFTIYVDKTSPSIKDFSCLTKTGLIVPEINDDTSGVDRSKIRWSHDGVNWNPGEEVLLDEGVYSLYFYAEDAAGNSAVRRGDITVDRSAPIINCTVSDVTNSRDLVLESFSIVDVIYSKISASFSFDGRGKESLQWVDGQNLKIPVYRLEEGRHVLNLFADDGNNNYSSRSFEFIIDKTNPVIEQVDFFSCGRKLEKGDFLRCENPYEDEHRFTLDVIINSYDKAGLEDGRVDCVLYSINHGDFVASNTLSFSTSEFCEGINEIRIKTVDWACNESRIYEGSFIKNSQVPLSPRISSRTHKAAKRISDSTRDNHCAFTIRSIAADNNEIEKIEWALNRCQIDREGKVVESTLIRSDEEFCGFVQDAAEECIDYGFLKDNEENEFYCITSRTTARNSLVSKRSDFIFRIDTSKPENFKSWLYPQVDDEKWYNSNFVSINWNQGKDRSGIGKIEYAIGNDLDDKESMWNVVPDLSKNLLWVQCEGKKLINVRCVDSVGNYDESILPVNIDTEFPYFENEKDFVCKWDNGSGEEKTDKVLIKWPRIIDSDSGVDYCKIRLHCLDSDKNIRDKFFYFTADVNECVVRNVNSFCNYLVEISAVDNAENEEPRVFVLPGKNSNNIQFVDYDYDYFYKNFHFTGRVRNYFKENKIVLLDSGKLILSSTDLSIHRNNELLDFISIDKNDCVFENGRILKCSSIGDGEEKYVASYRNQKFIVGKIGFDKYMGLSFQNSSYEQKTKDGNRKIDFKNITLGFPDHFSAESDFTRFSVGDIESNWFTLRDSNTLGFKSERKNFGRQYIETENIKLSDESGNRRIETYESSLDYEDGNLFSIPCFNNNILEIKENCKLTIVDSFFQDDKLYVNDGILKITEDNYTFDIHFSDFYVSEKTGLINTDAMSVYVLDEQLNRKYTESFGGVEIDLSDIDLRKEGIEVSFVLKTVYGDIKFNHAEIDNKGLHFEKTFTDEFEILLFNFKIRCKEYSISIVDENVCLNIGNGYFDYLNVEFDFSDLILDTVHKNKVVSHSKGIENRFLNTGYGKILLFENIIIGDNGIFANVNLPLPGSDRNILLEKVKLVSDGTLIYECRNPQTLEIGSVELNCNGLSFDGRLLCLEAGSIDVSKMDFFYQESKIDEFEFRKVKLSYEDTVEKGIWNYSFFTAYHGKFSLNCHDLCITSKGLGFSGNLNKSFLYQKGTIDINLSFRNIYMNPSLGLVCHENTERQSIDVFGHKVYVNDFYLDHDLSNRPVLISEKEFVEIPEIQDTVQLDFGRIVFYEDGNFICDERESPVSFTCVNEEIIKVFETKITSSGIMLSGSLSYPNVGFSYFSDKLYLLLNSDLTIENIVPITNVQWQCNGWNVCSENINVKDNKIFIDSNHVVYRGGKIDLGSFCLSGDFTFPVPQINSLERKIKIYGNDSKIINSYFSAGGLFCDIAVYFPSWMNNEFTILENVQLYEDGSFSDQTPINHIGIKGSDFNAEFHDSRFIKEYISIWKSEINFSSIDTQITLYNSKIYHDGRIEIEDGGISDINLWGLEVQIDSLSADSEGIAITGNIVLPAELPGCLSSKRADINSLKIGWNGNIISMDISTQVYSSIKIMGNWSLSADKIHISVEDGDPCICFDNSWIYFPPEYLIQKISVSNASINLKTFEFDFSKMECNLNAHMTFCGIHYEFNYISITKDFSVALRGKAMFVGDGFPDFLRDKTSLDAYFEIDRDGGISAFKTSVSGLGGKFSKDVDSIEVSDGYFELSKLNGEFFGSISGRLVFSDKAPDGLKNREFEIEKFRYNMTDHTLVELRASASFDSVDVFGIGIENLRTGINWNEESDKNIFLSGTVVLPSSMPDSLAGKRINIEEFVIENTGRISSFNFSYIHEGDINFQKGFVIKNPCIQSNISGNRPLIEVRCGLEFNGMVFKDGLAGLRTDATMRFSPSGIEYIDADFSIPTINIFNSFMLSNGFVGFSISSINEIEFSLKGILSFRNLGLFPDGLAGTSGNINRLKFSADGRLIDIDVAFNIEKINFFNSVEMNSIEIRLDAGEHDDLRILLGGRIEIVNDLIPQEFKNVGFTVRRIEYSSCDGLVDFSLSVDGELTFYILKGIELSISNVSFTKEGFSCSAFSKFKFNDKVEGFEFTIPRFSMDWSGRITALSGGAKLIEFSLGGFSSKIYGLNFISDMECDEGFSVSLSNMIISMPENCHVDDISVSNAGFRNGNFYGTLDTSEIKIDIAGFNLVFRNPYIDTEKRELGFTGISLECPDLLEGASLALFGVSISAYDGLRIQGVSVTLPNFTIGNGYGFRDVNVTFIKDGDDFLLSGGGKISIPNAGEIGAELSFANKCDLYPIGLKRAFFSFEVTGFFMGIPLGNTGLYLTGIRGGLAYGFPSEVVPALQPFYGQNGIRLQLGISIQDPIGGFIIQMKPDTWIDVHNGIWGMYGYLLVFKGYVNLNGMALAVLGPFGFTSNMEFNIIFCKGHVDFAIFKAGGIPKFTGSAGASFTIPKGSIFSFDINLIFKKVEVNIPPFDMNLFSLNAEFGDFTNGYRGFKSYFSVFGYDIGVFAAWAYIRVGNVTSYQLYDPMMFMIRNNSDETQLDEDTEFNDGFPEFLLTNQRNMISFRVDENLSKISLVCAYSDNVPVIRLKMADGSEHSTDDEDADVIYFDNYYLFSIDNPVEGDCTVDVRGADKESYKIILVNVDKGAGIDFHAVNCDGDSIQVTGNSNAHGENLFFYLTDEEKKYCFDLGETTSDEKGDFNLFASLEDFSDGKYFLAAKTIEKSGMLSNNIFYNGEIHVQHKETLLRAPEDLRIWEDENLDVDVKFSNTNGARSFGFYIEVVDEMDRSFVIDAGKVTSYHLMEGESGKKYRYRVCSYDKDRKCGAWTSFIEHEIGKKTYEETAIYCNVSEIDLGIVDPDSMMEGDIEVCFDNEDEFYAMGKVCDKIDGIKIFFNGSKKSETGKTSVHWISSISEYCKAGKYRISAKIFDEKNIDSKCKVDFLVEVRKPDFCIDSMYPEKLNGQIENVLFVTGKGMQFGCKFYLDDEQLSTVGDVTNISGVKKILVPKTNYYGKRNFIVENSDGERIYRSVEFINPYYEVQPRMRNITISPGRKAVIPVDIKRFCDYSGKVDIEIKSSSNDLLVSRSELVNDSFIISLYAGKDSSSGSEKIIIEYGESGSTVIDVDVKKMSDRYGPVIDCLIPNIAFSGKKIEVVGSRFDEKSILLLDGKEIPHTHIDENRIAFEVTKDMSSGNVEIQNENGVSNSKTLTIRRHYLEIEPEKTFIQLNKGEEIEIPFKVYADTKNYELDLVYDHSLDVEATIKKMIPFDDCYSLCLKLKNEAESGDWKIGIVGKSKYYTEYKEVNVYLNKKEYINTSEVYSGLVNVKYHARVYLENYKESSKFSIKQGRLPKGIQLSESGIISGAPIETGLFRFLLSAENEDGLIASKDLSIEIHKSGNTSRFYDPNNSMNGSDFEDCDTSMTEEKFYRLNYENMNIDVYENNLIVRNGENEIWRKNSLNKIIDARISGRKLFVHYNNGTLMAMDVHDGFEICSWNDIDIFSANLDSLITSSHGQVFEYNAHSCEVKEIKKNWNGLLLDNILFVGNEVYTWKNRLLKKLTADGQKKCVVSGQILRCLSDFENIYVITESDIYKLSFDLKIVGHKEFLCKKFMNASIGKDLILKTENHIYHIDKENLEKKDNE